MCKTLCARLDRRRPRDVLRDTSVVKTAISLPDELYDRITECAREWGVSRSDFFAEAALRYLEDLDGS